MWLYLNAAQYCTADTRQAHTCARQEKPHKGLISEIGVAHHFLWCSPVQELFSDSDLQVLLETRYWKL